MSWRLARSREVMTRFCSSHWLTPNCSWMSCALEDDELCAELLLQLPLPLKGQVGRTDDEDPFGQAPQLQLAEEEARHDGLAGPGVVGQEEPHPGELQEVVVDGFELVRQRVYPGDGETEVGIELVGDAQGVGLKAQAQEGAVAGEGVGEAPDV